MGQQQWASQYINWHFTANLDIWNIDQQVWIPRPNTTSYWPLQWSWKDSTEGGYLGLQQGFDGTQNVRFSIWNAIACRNGNCTLFEGEGSGYTCTLPITIDTNKFYRYRLWRQEADTDGVWWGAWLIEEVDGLLVDHYIGGLKVPTVYKVINPSSIRNFVEYWGDDINCAHIPLSIVGFTPPAINYHGKGTSIYDGYLTYAGSHKAEGNYCGTEKQQNGNGALITTKPYDFGFANGVIILLGGNNPTPIFNEQSPLHIPNR